MNTTSQGRLVDPYNLLAHYPSKVDAVEGLRLSTALVDFPTEGFGAFVGAIPTPDNRDLRRFPLQANGTGNLVHVTCGLWRPRPDNDKGSVVFPMSRTTVVADGIIHVNYWNVLRTLMGNYIPKGTTLAKGILKMGIENEPRIKQERLFEAAQAVSEQLRKMFTKEQMRVLRKMGD